MKKKIIGIILSSMVAFSLVACGGSDESAATQNEPVVEEEKDDATAVDEEEKDDETAVDDDTTDTSTDEEEEVAATEDFTILDVTTDLVDVGIYAIDENNTEYVITLFRDLDDNSYISLMQVAEDGTGDLICGAYDENSVTITPDEENGVDWTVFDIVDVYTETECTIVFAEGDDGSVAITNDDFSIILEGEYLSNDDTIDYMGVAASFIE